MKVVLDGKLYLGGYIMAKFKVNDIVVGNKKASWNYGATKEGVKLKVTHVNNDGSFVGIVTYDPRDKYVGMEFGVGCKLDPECFDLFENKKIVITKRDDSVMARLYSAERLVKETKVDATGDFNKDAKDAFEELYRPTISPFSFDEVKHYYDTDMIEKWRDEILRCCFKKPSIAKIYETISYKEFKWDDFRDGTTAIKVSSNRQLEEILNYFYRRYPSPASRPVVMFDLKNFDTDISERSLQYYIYVLDGHVYIGETTNLYITNVTKTVNANELWISHAFTHKWESFTNGFTALYFDEDNIDKILYTLNCKGYTWAEGESPIPTEYKPPCRRGYICMRDGHITYCSVDQTKEMFEDSTSHIHDIVRPR